MSIDSRSLSILFAAGGTGGHLFPALAIAEEVKRTHPDVRIDFVGTKGKIEARVIPEKGFAFHTIWISGFHRRLTVDNLLFPVKVVVSLFQSFFLIRKVKPNVVVGTGGYVCGPILSIASLMKIPTVVHESNSYPGVTTRMVASKTSKVFITFEATKKWLPKLDADRIELVGNPTREALGSVTQKEGAEYFGLKPNGKTLLVFGGSLGAASINYTIEKIAGELVNAGIQLIWQTGEKDFERYKFKYIFKNLGWKVHRQNGIRLCGGRHRPMPIRRDNARRADAPRKTGYPCAVSAGCGEPSRA